MAWELQTHMHSYVHPSILRAAEEAESPHDWLARRRADQTWDGQDMDAYHALVLEYAELPDSALLDSIADHAIEQGLTTNGAHELYLDDCTTIPWCSEDEHLAYWS